MDEYNNNSYYTMPPTQEPDPSPHDSKRKKIAILCTGLVLLITLVAVLNVLWQNPLGKDTESGTEELVSSAEDSETPAAEESAAESAEDSVASDTQTSLIPEIVHSIDNLTIAQIAAKASPSVVEITTESVVTGSNMMQYISSGAGSGVILSADGYILTNNHVIEDASNITVTTTDGTSYVASLIGLDETLDVALLKVDATDLTPATVASSADLIVGQEVVAIGNPLGQLGGTVTNGIISALNRSITISDRTMNLLQTNAAINPGNSGGGLFDASGNLVGLVVAKYADEEIEGIGFAIPIDDVMAVLDDLYQYGYVRGRVSLGMSLLDINSQQMAWMYHVSRQGVYIYQVTSGSGAEAAGLRSGDCILSFNGTSISSSDDVTALLSDLQAGDTVSVEIYRSGQQLTVTMTIDQYIPDAIQQTINNASAAKTF